MIKKLFIILIMVITTNTLIISCSNRIVSTNLDKDNFEQYFSASAVKIYNNEKDINTRYQLIGSVEGQDCQIKTHHAVPDKVNARTQARQQAFNLKANGVVFTGCAMLSQEKLSQLNKSNDARQCHAVIICYAKAYVIETNDSNN